MLPGQGPQGMVVLPGQGPQAKGVLPGQGHQGRGMLRCSGEGQAEASWKGPGGASPETR